MTTCPDLAYATPPDMLNAPPCPMLDRLTRLATKAFVKPFAAVSLTDTTCQWLKSRTGPIPLMIPSYDAPCTRVAQTKRALAVPDLLTHPTYRSGLLAAHGVRFYAGHPLIMPSGHAIGAFCIMGPDPHDATTAEMALLHDMAALTMAQVELRHSGGRLDPISGLPNRNQLLEDLGESLGVGHLGVCGRGHGPAARPSLLALIDLARPDELAHILRAVGSACLGDLVRRDAATLRAATPAGTRVYHVGATQFALIAPPGTEQRAFVQFLEVDLLHHALGAHALFATTCAAGLAPFMPGEAPALVVLRRAHAALDDARIRRVALGLYAPAQETAFHRARTLLQDFAEALRSSPTGCAGLDGRHGLRLVFQPRLELATGRCLGVEALLRWNHPELGEVGPAEFVPLVEKTTMARPMMRWVLDRALDQMRAWRGAGLVLRVSINISPANLDEPDFATHVLAAVAAYGLPLDSLELELTESAFLAENTPAMQQLRVLSEAGLRIAIDDFGTGYSSLSYLQRLPADVIKIDQSFIRGLTANSEDSGRRRSLITAMIGLSHDLGYRVVAEGIETEAAAEMLRSLACDEVQGFHYARPMAPRAFLAWHGENPGAEMPPVQAALLVVRPNTDQNARAYASAAM